MGEQFHRKKKEKKKYDKNHNTCILALSVITLRIDFVALSPKRFIREYFKNIKKKC